MVEEKDDPGKSALPPIRGGTQGPQSQTAPAVGPAGLTAGTTPYLGATGVSYTQSMIPVQTGKTEVAAAKAKYDQNPSEPVPILWAPNNVRNLHKRAQNRVQELEQQLQELNEIMDAEKKQYRRTKEALDSALKQHQEELERQKALKESLLAENEQLLADRKDVKDRNELETTMRQISAEKDSLTKELRAKKAHLQRVMDERDLVKDEIRVRTKEIQLLKDGMEYKDVPLELDEWLTTVNVPWHMGWDAVSDVFKELCEILSAALGEKTSSYVTRLVVPDEETEGLPDSSVPFDSLEMEYLCTCGQDAHLVGERLEGGLGVIKPEAFAAQKVVHVEEVADDDRVHFLPKHEVRRKREKTKIGREAAAAAAAEAPKHRTGSLVSWPIIIEHEGKEVTVAALNVDTMHRPKTLQELTPKQLGKIEVAADAMKRLLTLVEVNHGFALVPPKEPESDGRWSTVTYDIANQFRKERQIRAMMGRAALRADLAELAACDSPSVNLVNLFLALYCMLDMPMKSKHGGPKGQPLIEWANKVPRVDPDEITSLWDTLSREIVVVGHKAADVTLLQRMQEAPVLDVEASGFSVEGAKAFAITHVLNKFSSIQAKKATTNADMLTKGVGAKTLRLLHEWVKNRAQLYTLLAERNDIEDNGEDCLSPLEDSEILAGQNAELSENTEKLIATITGKTPAPVLSTASEWKGFPSFSFTGTRTKHKGSLAAILALGSRLPPLDQMFPEDAAVEELAPSAVPALELKEVAEDAAEEGATEGEKAEEAAQPAAEPAPAAAEV